MTRVDEFNSFYAATSAQTLQVTYALSGDRKVAQEATVDAYRRAWRDWSKIRGRHPLGTVRTEAWKGTALSRGTHPLRRPHEQDSDEALLAALGSLSSDDRRLIVLMTLGDVDLEEASAEVGVTAEEGIESVTDALTALEARLGQPLDEIERRMNALSAVTEALDMPPADAVRTAARRGRRRNTVALVVAALVAVVGGGVVVTDGGNALADRSGLPYREKIGAEKPDVVLNAAKLDESDLLTAQQVTRLDPESRWKVVSTDTDKSATQPWATCPTQRFASKDPLKTFVRTFSSSASKTERVAQAVEVAKSDEAAEKAYEKILGWFADCQHPRVQISAAYTVRRPFGDFEIVKLRSNQSPTRSFTVGFSHSGTVTSTLVHEADGTGPSIPDFAATLNDSVARLCADSGGRCTDSLVVSSTNPPPTTRDPGFLGIVDLPPIADVDRVWAGTDPIETKTNPAATLCDGATFRGKAVKSASSRIFLIPQATQLPERFGIAETVARFDDDDAAQDYVDKLTDKVEECPDDNLSASLSQEARSKSTGSLVRTWRVGLELSSSTTVYYRMGLVRRGSDVAQVTFTSSPQYDIKSKTFLQLAERAGERLIYLD